MKYRGNLSTEFFFCNMTKMHLRPSCIQCQNHMSLTLLLNLFQVCKITQHLHKWEKKIIYFHDINTCINLYTLMLKYIFNHGNSPKFDGCNLNYFLILLMLIHILSWIKPFYGLDYRWNLSFFDILDIITKQ